MAKGASKSAVEVLEDQEVSPVNTDDLDYALFEAERRVLEIQTKLHRWAGDDSGRRFDDLFNLVADPAFLLVAWGRVRGNKGARTAGVDGHTASSVALLMGVEDFLDRLRASLRDRSFRPLPVRERMIPKAGGKLRRLGIATITDRVVQASLKLELEPIFEADFLPCSYGFRPNRRAHDAVAEVRFLASHSYEWIVEGDIKACFDEISHPALLERVHGRVGDKRVLGLVKAFLKAGILGEDRVLRENNAGTPQGSILSPLLSNVALSILDESIAEDRERHVTQQRREDRTLWGTGVVLPQHAVLTEDACLEERLDQAQHAFVPDSTVHPFQKSGMRDLIETGLDVALHDPLIRVGRQETHLGHRVMSPSIRAEPVGTREEVRLENRLQHQLQRCLHHPVGDRGDPQTTQLAASLGDHPLPHRKWTEAAIPQRGPQPVEEVLDTHQQRDRRRSMPVDPGCPCTLVTPHPTPRHQEERRISNEIEQIIEPATRIITGPTVQLGLNLQYPVLRLEQGVIQVVGIHRRHLLVFQYLDC